MPLTRTIRGTPVEVPLGPEDGVPHQSVGNADDITTVPVRRIGDYLTALNASKQRQLEEAIHFALELE